MLTRRSFIVQLSAAVAAIQGTSFLADVRRADRVGALGPQAVGDALNGLLAFIVPGSDSFSIAQGVSTANPGGVDAGGLDVLIEALDLAGPPPPPFTETSTAVASILDQFATIVRGNPTVGFADLTFAEKMAVFQALEAIPQLAPLAGVLPALTGFIAVSEAGVFDPATRTVTSRPVGWELTGYQGVADGRDEFVGYYQNRRKAVKSDA